MPHTLILILVGSGCLLLRESGAEIYGTYSVFDHLGSYSEPNRSPPKNVTIIQKRTTPITKTLPVSSPSQQQQQQQHGELRQPVSPQQQIYPPAAPLVAPQYEDSIARPFSDVHESSGSASPSATPGTLLQQQQTATALQVTTTSPPPVQSQARVPLYVYNPGLARRLGLGTFMMGSVLYGLTLLPALLAVGATTGVGPFAGNHPDNCL